MTVPMLPTEFLYLQTHTVTMYPQDLYQAHNKAKGKAGGGDLYSRGETQAGCHRNQSTELDGD